LTTCTEAKLKWDGLLMIAVHLPAEKYKFIPDVE